MAPHTQFFPKTIFILLVIIFPSVLLAIALDQHFQGYSSTCPICEAKYSFNGTESPFAFEFYFKIVNYVLGEPPISQTTPFVLHLQNKSPPISS